MLQSAWRAPPATYYDGVSTNVARSASKRGTVKDKVCIYDRVEVSPLSKSLGGGQFVT